jgi:transposase-like protein
MTEDYHLPICTCCYAVRVEPHRRNSPRPTCMTCAEKLARAVKHTVAPLNKSNYMLFTDVDMLKQLNPKRTT